jgi:hypothetical protein
LIQEQYGVQANEIIDRVNSYFKKHYTPSTTPEQRAQPVELERPKNVPIHEWSLLQRARKKAFEAAAVINSSKSDFGGYFDDPVII